MDIQEQFDRIMIKLERAHGTLSKQDKQNVWRSLVTRERLRITYTKGRTAMLVSAITFGCGMYGVMFLISLTLLAIYGGEITSSTQTLVLMTASSFLPWAVFIIFAEPAVTNGWRLFDLEKKEYLEEWGKFNKKMGIVWK